MAKLRNLALGLIAGALIVPGIVKCVPSVAKGIGEMSYEGFCNRVEHLRPGGSYEIATACAEGIAPWAILTGAAIGIYAISRDDKEKKG